MFWMTKASAALIAMAIPLSAAAQSMPETKAAFILDIAGFTADFKSISRDLRTSLLDAIAKNDNRPVKITPKAAERFATIFEEEVKASESEFRSLAAGFLVQRLTPQELDALHAFYSSPAGLSASTKLHWATANVWLSILPQANALIWPRIRERLAQDPELRRTLMQ